MKIQTTKKLFNWEYELIERFVQLMIHRVETGRDTYGMDYLEKDNLTELQYELLDVANYALLEFMKIELLRMKELKENENNKNNV